jgi:hypothetical protein
MYFLHWDNLKKKQNQQFGFLMAGTIHWKKLTALSKISAMLAAKLNMP